MASFEATSTSTTQTQYIANGVLLHITAASVLDVQRSRTRTNFCLSSHLISHCRKVFKSNHMCSFLKKEEGEEVKRFLCYNLNWGTPDFSTAPFCTASEYQSEWSLSYIMQCLHPIVREYQTLCEKQFMKNIFSNLISKHQIK